jgi:hypothetical protein
MLTNGSGYQSKPNITVKSFKGIGAILSGTVTGADSYNTYSSIRARVRKNGIGVSPGYWSTTRSFLNSDKYIQDSKFYQDYSYQIRTAFVLEKYKNIMYNTFHVAGSELFGQFYSVNIETASPLAILHDLTSTSSFVVSSDSTYITADETDITSDEA